MSAQDTDDPWSSVQFDAHGRLVDYSEMRRASFGEPPRLPKHRHVTDVPPPILGRRLVLMYRDGPVYDLVAASEVFTDDAGTWILVVEDWRYHLWFNTPKYRERHNHCPRAIAHATLNVWVER